MQSVSKKNPQEQFIDKLSASVADGTFVRLVLSAPVKPESSPEKALVRVVELKNALHFSITLRYAKRDETKNLPINEGVDWIRERLGSEFSSALLGTTTRDWQLHISPTSRAKMVGHSPAQSSPPSRSHDHSRATLLDDFARDWLHGLGVVDSAGKVFPSMADKHRQICRYIEILSHLAKDCGWINDALSKNVNSSLSERGCVADQPQQVLKHERTAADAPTPHTTALLPPLAFADMGCGKGYLTFAAWHLFQRVWQRPIHIFGVEAREDLVATTSQLARKIGAKNLEFISGTIQFATLPKLDALIALHACNTATDDAIRRGIELEAKLIVVAPCCHQELRPQIGQPEPLTSVLRHGVMEGRMSEWLTDGLRALFLEWAGYRTKIFEFVSSEHTPKNLMISAVREKEAFVSESAKERIEKLKDFFGIKHHALDALLEKPESKSAS